MQLFAAIDFETSSSERNSACAIGYVIFNQSKIVENIGRAEPRVPSQPRSMRSD